MSVSINGPQGQIATYRAGSGGGMSIVLLHSDSGRASQWHGVMNAMPADYQLTTFDFRGHGNSDPALNQDYSYEGRAEDLAAVVDAFSLHRFVIAAHSGSTGVALAYAVSHPDQVAGILLVDPPMDSSGMPQEQIDELLQGLAGPGGLEFQQGFYASIAGANAVVQTQVLADVESVDPAARAGVARATMGLNPENFLEGYRGPLAIIASETFDQPTALFNLRPEIPHKIIKGAGHWINLEEPQILADVIREFAEGLEAR